jgi:hypothetical protein
LWRTESNLRGCRCWAFKMPEIDGTEGGYETKVKKRKGHPIGIEGNQDGKLLGNDPRKFKHYILFVRGAEQQ